MIKHSEIAEKNTEKFYREKSFKIAVASLNDGNFVKIICGAANTSPEQAERISLAYSLAGADCLDINASEEIFIASKKGIKKAREIFLESPDKFPNFNEPVIMASLNCGADIHFRKAQIDPQSCTNCFECMRKCFSGALYSFENKLKYNYDKCFGCGKCADACSCNIIKMNTIKYACIPKEIKAVEIHTGSSSIREVKDFLELVVEDNSLDLISFCINAERFTPKELVEYANAVLDAASKVSKCFAGKKIIQIDASPMSGSEKPYSSLKSLVSALILIENNVDAHIHVSGGANFYTKKLAEQLGIKISGVGYGSYAKKIISNYINSPSENEFYSNLRRIVNIATNLVEKR